MPTCLGISATDLDLEGRPGEELRAEVSVFTRERKHVYARAASDQPWLEVAGVTARGRCATARLLVRSVPPLPREMLQGRVQVTANGGRRFTVTVRLHIRDGPAGSDGDWREAPPPVRRPGPGLE